MLSLNERSHTMPFWATSRFKPSDVSLRPADENHMSTCDISMGKIHLSSFITGIGWTPASGTINHMGLPHGMPYDSGLSLTLTTRLRQRQGKVQQPVNSCSDLLNSRQALSTTGSILPSRGLWSPVTGPQQGQGDLQVGEELSSHDALQQHVKVGAVLEAGHQIHHEAAVALSLNLLLTLHMRLHMSAMCSHTSSCCCSHAIHVSTQPGTCLTTIMQTFSASSYVVRDKAVPCLLSHFTEYSYLCP